MDEKLSDLTQAEADQVVQNSEYASRIDDYCEFFPGSGYVYGLDDGTAIIVRQDKQIIHLKGD